MAICKFTKAKRVSIDGPLERVLAENKARNRALELAAEYDPVVGVGCCGRRRSVETVDGVRLLPTLMLKDKEWREGMDSTELARLRCRYDFEFWAATCVKISDKTTGRNIPFVLNFPQRRVVAALEKMRCGGDPIRMIILKARQWGSSTLVQLYLGWIQTCLMRNWNSFICAHVKDTSSTIRGIYTKMLDNYPEELWDGDSAPCFKPFERALNIRQIEGRGCRVTIGSSESQDSVRGSDIKMAHLSEVAFWRDTASNNPEQLLRSICGSINTDPMTLIVMESTANGVGDFFHGEWLRAESGKSDKVAVFVPWFEIEIYRRKVENVPALIKEMDDYERNLWNEGLTLEMINWFHLKRREQASLSAMLAEYPTTSMEAFSVVDRHVFNPSDCEAVREDCDEPALRGDLYGDDPVGRNALRNIRFMPSATGKLKVWREPVVDPTRPRGGPYERNNRYVVSVDIGGRVESSDWSVIVVVDRQGGRDGGTPEIAAQWRGHCDHDLLAFHAARIASWYGGALLVFESNTLESESDDDPSLFILKQVQNLYRNLYERPGDEGSGNRIGFHTNRHTKSMIINRLIAMVRDHAYVEHDSGAVDELINYESTPKGGFTAHRGCHDDMLMARAIAFHALAELPRMDVSYSDYLSAYN